MDNTTNDSFDLYYGLFMYNKVQSRQRSGLEHSVCSYSCSHTVNALAVLMKQICELAPWD